MRIEFVLAVLLATVVSGDNTAKRIATYDFGKFSAEFKAKVIPESGCNLIVHVDTGVSLCIHPTDIDLKAVTHFQEEFQSLENAYRVFPYCSSGQKRGRPLNEVAELLGPEDNPWGLGNMYLLEDLKPQDNDKTVRGNKIHRIDRISGKKL